ncbi:MAG: S41 family peptidase [Aggregatilineales bacterium]
MKQYIKSLLIGAIAGTLLVLTFASGFFLREFIDIPTVMAFSNGTDTEDSGYPLLDEVQALLDDVYLRDQKTYTERQYAAIRGLLSTLDDPNTFFIEPVVAQSEADTLAGTYGGIGVLLRRSEAGQFVLSPYPDSPAIRAGISEGDVLLAINGQAIQPDASPDTIDQQMRGEVIDENGVEIQVLKLDGTTLSSFIIFDVINVPSVLWRQMNEDERIGYVQILRFTNRTPDELGTALDELQAANIGGLILDLRNNTGGLLRESVTVGSAFLEDGVVIYERSQDEEVSLDVDEEFTQKLTADIPIVVLINNRTASASEVVAGALQARGRAILIGQQSYGKGTVQQIFALSDGSSVHITSSEWLVPDRTPIDGSGLTPDIGMIPDENRRDVESGEAIRYLQSIFEEGINNE